MANPEDIVVKPGGYITSEEAGRLTAIKRKKAKEKQVAGEKRVAGLAAQREKEKAAFTKGLGVSGESIQRKEGAQEDYSPYINTGLKKPEDYKKPPTGLQADPGTTVDDMVAPYKKTMLGELTSIREMPVPKLRGAGTKESPFTGTRSKTSGFGEATPEDIAMREANTEGGRYLSGYSPESVTRGVAAYDVYHDDQMRQAAANERGSSAHLADIGRQKAIEKQERLQKAIFRDGGRYGGLSQRRRSEVLAESGERVNELRGLGTEERGQEKKREVGMAEAGSARFTGQGQMAKAQADLQVQASKEGIALAKLGSEEDRAAEARYTSPAQATELITGIINAGDYPETMINNPELMGKVRRLVMTGMDPREAMMFYMNNPDTAAGASLGRQGA